MIEVKKIAIAILALFLFSVVLFSNKVYATTEVDANYMQTIIDMLPNKINLDIPEVECEKAENVVISYIEEALKSAHIAYKVCDDDNGKYIKLTEVNIEGYDIEISDITGSIYSKEDFYNSEVYIEAVKRTENENTTNSNYTKRKNIELVYNNTEDYNLEDENFVNSLSLKSPKYYEVNYDFMLNISWDEMDKNYMNLISKYYEDIINDKTVTVKATSGAGGTDGGLNLWTWESGTHLGIFKNGKLYRCVTVGEECTVPVFYVPNDISSDQLESYILNFINEKFEKYFSEVEINGLKEKAISLKKGNTLGIEIENSYIVEIESSDIQESTIIIRKEAPKKVSDVDTKTSIKIDTTTDIVPSTAKLVAKKITEGSEYNTAVKALEKDARKFVLYDINLLNDNIKIQPNGNVTISTPVPAEYDTTKIVVYRISDDGIKTKLNASVKDGFVVFETDHFSSYAVVEENKTTSEDTTKTTEDEKNEDTTIEESNTEETKKEHIKDETPKTGNNNISTIVYSILSVLLSAGIAVVKKF